MTAKQLDVAIIGTGTAALSAAAVVRKSTDNFIIVSNGIHGTTCVRNGCMPSVALIHGAGLYHQREMMAAYGIAGTDGLRLDIPALLREVRARRAHFLSYTLETTEGYGEHLVQGDVRFLAPDRITVNGVEYHADRIVIATGSTPIIPPECDAVRELVLTSDDIFEQEDLPPSIAMLGSDLLGIEMGQALSRLGIAVTMIQTSQTIGGCSDPEISACARDVLRGEMQDWLEEVPALALRDGMVDLGNGRRAHKLFVAMHRKANLEGMGLEELGIATPGKPLTNYNPETMQLGDLPIFIAGDVTQGHSILNEAADEGRIAGHNASQETPAPFRRRTHLQICHSDPSLGVAGAPFETLDPEAIAIGQARFDDQGTAKLVGQACGLVRVYADRATGRLLGAELFAPGGEHLAHLLAWLIDRETTIFDALQLPFYHPSVEEGLRSAFRDLAEKVTPRQNLADA